MIDARKQGKTVLRPFSRQDGSGISGTGCRRGSRCRVRGGHSVHTAFAGKPGLTRQTETITAEGRTRGRCLAAAPAVFLYFRRGASVLGLVLVEQTLHEFGVDPLHFVIIVDDFQELLPVLLHHAE